MSDDKPELPFFRIESAHEFIARIERMAEKLREERGEGRTRGKWILDDEGNPVEETDLLKWAEWFETANRVVAWDAIFSSELDGKGVEVSTVFLGIDHLWFGGGPPVLWETMIFGAEEAGIPSKWHMFRYSSRREAKELHAHLVRLLKRYLRRRNRER